MTPAELDRAVAASLAGDQSAYRPLVEACEPRVRAVAAALIPEREAVQDCVVEVLVTAFRELGRYRAGSGFVAWLDGQTRHAALDRRRIWLRRQAERRAHRGEIEAAIDAEVLARAPAAVDAVGALAEGVAALEQPARAVVEERYRDGATLAGIAQARERSDAWARVVLHRARETLAARLRARGADGP